MKTFIMILGLLTGCGRFDEAGSDKGSGSAAEQHDQNVSLWDIAKGPLETADFSFDLKSVLVHEAEVKGDMNDVFNYWKTEDGKKKSNFFKKMPDGSKLDCNVSVFIGIIHNYKNTGDDRGAIFFDSLLNPGGKFDVCNIAKGEWLFGFSGGKVFLKYTLE